MRRRYKGLLLAVVVLAVVVAAAHVIASPRSHASDAVSAASRDFL